MRTLSPELVTKILESSEKIFFYGACEIAECSLNGADLLGLKISGIFDSNIKTTSGRYLQAMPLLGQDELPGIDKRSHFIITCSHFISVEQHLKSLGFYNIYDHCILVNEVLNSKQLEGNSRIMAERMLAASREKVKHATQQVDGELIIPSIDVVVTEKCTLKCADCANLMQYFKTPKHIDREYIFTSLSTLSGLSDSISELRILGGEPFIRKDIGSIIDFCTGLENVKKVIIYSNGTLLPPEQSLPSMRNEKIFVQITDYGKLSRGLRQIERVFGREGISYFVYPLPESWDDSATLMNFNRSERENQLIFDACCAKYLYTLMHGKLYRCPYSASLDALGMNTVKEGDYLDIYSHPDLSRASLQSYIYSPKFVSPCAHCRGRSPILGRVPPARQCAGGHPECRTVEGESVDGLFPHLVKSQKASQ